MTLSPKANDALTRLRAAVKGREPHYEPKASSLTVAVAEVNPRDIVDLCGALPNDGHAAYLGASSANTLEMIPEVPAVCLHVTDILQLIRAAEELDEGVNDQHV